MKRIFETLCNFLLGMEAHSSGKVKIKIDNCTIIGLSNSFQYLEVKLKKKIYFLLISSI